MIYNVYQRTDYESGLHSVYLEKYHFYGLKRLMVDLCPYSKESRVLQFGKYRRPVHEFS